MDNARSHEGFILLAQEHRFRLVDDAGDQHALVLGPAVGIGPQELAALCARRTRVRVQCRPSKHTRLHTATALRPLSNEAPLKSVAPPYPPGS